MELIKEYGSYLLTALSIIVTIISFILKNKSNKSTRKVFRILQILPDFINEAEKVFNLVNKSGSDKLAYVLNKIQVLCAECRVSYDSSFWENKIEEYLTTPQKKI